MEYLLEYSRTECSGLHKGMDQHSKGRGGGGKGCFRVERGRATPAVVLNFFGKNPS